jgi:hypothetical protein
VLPPEELLPEELLPEELLPEELLPEELLPEELLPLEDPPLLDEPLAAELTVMPKAGSAALACPSLTLMTMPGYVPTFDVAGVPLN